MADVVDLSAHIDARVPFATVSGARGVGVRRARASFAELAAELRRHGETREGKDGPGVVVSSFREGPGTTRATAGKTGRFRQEALISETWLLGLDFDSRPDDPAVVLAPLASKGLAYIAYSTHSHGRLDYLRAKARKELASRDEGEALEAAVERYARAPRYRVLVRLARSVSPTEYRALWAWLDRYLGGGSDAACSDPTRLFFTPRRAADDAHAPSWVTYSPGGALDPDSLPDGDTAAELLSEAAAAGRRAPRSTLSLGEQERRREVVQALPEGQRTEAEKRARGVLEAALSRVRLSSAGGRRKGLFSAACRIGEWAHVLGPSGEAAWRDALLDAARYLPDPEDHARQVDNGIARGRGNPVDVRHMVARPVYVEPSAALPLAEARESLVQLVRRAARTPGVTAIAADPGAGKTTAVVAALPALLAEGKRIRIAVPTNRLARDVLRDVRRAIVDSGDIVSSCGLEPKRTAKSCVKLAAFTAARRACGPAGAEAVCRACDLHPSRAERGACAFMAEARRSYSVTVTTHALEAARGERATAGPAQQTLPFDPPLPDVLVVDERPDAATQHEIGFQDICKWRGAGDLICDDAWEPLSALLRGEDRMHSAALAAACPPGALTVRRDEEGRVFSSLAASLLGHAERAATGGIPDEILNAPEAAALEALEAACASGWKGAYVTGGKTPKLRVTRSRPPAGPATTTLYLDGTATVGLARALFGADARFERLEVAMHPETSVSRVLWSASKRALPPKPPDDENDTPSTTRARRARDRVKRAETLNRLAAVVQRYESPHTAWVLHKAWCDDLAVKGLLSDAFAAKRVTYYGAAEAVGSNRLATCSRIVLADYYVPGGEVVAQGEALSLRAGDDAEDWHSEALEALETSARTQAAYRVRPGERAKEIVWLCERELPGLGWPDPVDVDIDELVLDATGVVPRGKKGAALLLRRAVRERGVFVLPSRPEWRRAAKAWSTDGCCAAWAEGAGVALSYARTSAGGSPSVVFYAHGTDPAPEAVATAVVEGRGDGAPPLAWIEWNGERVALASSTEDEGARLLALLRELPSDERPTFEALAARAGLSASTVRRRLRPLGVVSLDDLARMRETTPLPAAPPESPQKYPEAADPKRCDAVAPPLPLPKRKQAQGISYASTPLGRERDAEGYPRRKYVRDTYRRSRVS